MRDWPAVQAGRPAPLHAVPPEQPPNLYVGPIDFTLAAQPTSLVDFEAPDFERFPAFADALVATEIAGLKARLAEGLGK